MQESKYNLILTPDCIVVLFLLFQETQDIPLSECCPLSAESSDCTTKKAQELDTAVPTLIRY